MGPNRSGSDPDADLAGVRERVAEGAELYNEGAFWDAHEAWEEAWHTLQSQGRDDLADLLQGLILATAAFENLRRGKPGGFAVQGAKALTRLRRHRGLGRSLGLADEDGFGEALLDVYLTVQRERVEELEELDGEPPGIEVVDG